MDTSKQKRDAALIRRYAVASPILGAFLGLIVFADPFVTALARPGRFIRPPFPEVLGATAQGITIFALGLVLGGILRGLASVIELTAERLDKHCQADRE